jgi:hypothetical protein
MAERRRIAVLRHIGLALERAFELFAGFAGHGGISSFRNNNALDPSGVRSGPPTGNLC